MRKAKMGRQTRMVGMRVSQRLYSLLDDGAKAEGLSVTAYCRLTLARALNFNEVVPETRPRRPPRQKSISKDIKTAIEVLGLLIDIRMNLSYLSRKLAASNANEPMRTEQVIELGRRIDEVQRNIDLVCSTVLGDQS